MTMTQTTSTSTSHPQTTVSEHHATLYFVGVLHMLHKNVIRNAKCHIYPRHNLPNEVVCHPNLLLMHMCYMTYMHIECHPNINAVLGTQKH